MWKTNPNKMHWEWSLDNYVWLSLCGLFDILPLRVIFSLLSFPIPQILSVLASKIKGKNNNPHTHSDDLSRYFCSYKQKLRNSPLKENKMRKPTVAFRELPY